MKRFAWKIFIVTSITHAQHGEHSYENNSGFSHAFLHEI
jgi:hypothetical protein